MLGMIGFENFYPKNHRKINHNNNNKKSSGNNENNPRATNKSSSPESSSSQKNKNHKFKFNGNNNNNNNKNNNNDNPINASLVTLGALALFLAVSNNDKNSADGREIQWSELREFVLRNSIDRIQISPNRNVARIILKPNATSSSSSSGNLGDGKHHLTFDEDSSSSVASSSQFDGTNHDFSSMQFGGNTSASSSVSGSYSNEVSSSSSGHYNHPRGEVCHMTISNPEVCTDWIYLQSSFTNL